MSRRTERIAEQLRSEIARVLTVEVTDPRIRFVTLTRVDVAPDLSRAVVLWSAIESDDADSVEQIGAGLRSAASFIRGRLAQELPLRRVPELHFKFDPSLVRGDEMLALLKNLSTERAKAEPEAGAEPESRTGSTAGTDADGAEGTAASESTDGESS